MSESFVSAEELNEFFCKKLEDIAIEYHDAVRNFRGIEDESLITGVEFLAVFDVRAIVDGLVKSSHYGLAGKQSETTTLGMAIRAAHFADDLIEERDLEV